MAIDKLVKEDPTLKVSTDPETGQTILAGMGELHLEIIVDRMKREFGVEANVGKPQVAYRETIRNKAEVRVHAQEADRRQRPVRQGEAAGRAAAAGQGLRVRERNHRRHDSEGIHQRRSKRASARRSKAACSPAIPMIGHQGRVSSTAAITTSTRRKWRSRSAGSICAQGSVPQGQAGAARAGDARRSGGAGRVHGSVNGDLISRRGRLEGMELRGGTQIIKAMVPLSEDVRLCDRSALAHAGPRQLSRCTSVSTKKCRAPSRKRSSARCRAR